MSRPDSGVVIGTDWICDRCGRFSSAEVACTCRQPHDPVAVRRRHKEALRRARHTDAAVGRRTRAA